jgi:hypothetical protein
MISAVLKGFGQALKSPCEGWHSPAKAFVDFNNYGTVRHE